MLLTMKQIEQRLLTGERALFSGSGLHISDSTFADGESPLKESNHIELEGSSFQWKYPLWYSRDIRMNGGALHNGARAGIWYSDMVTMKNTTIKAPKTFRRSKNITLEHVSMPNAEETFWMCSGVTLRHVVANGNYFGMNSSIICAEDLTLTGDYAFDGCTHIKISTRAVQKKAATGIFGYTEVPGAYYEAVSNWWETEHHFPVQKEWILFCTGVVPAISSIVRKLTTAGENVLIQPPVYNIFYNSILNNGRNVIESDLVYDGKSYRIDYGDLEQKLADPQTTMMILCNPHNPIGKIWDRETLLKIGSLCAKHHVLAVSDEIHCDLAHPGYHYVPFASVSEINANNSITCAAPTKAFNLAGLQTASIIVPDPVLRHKVKRGINTDEIAEPNAFAAEAAIAAFTYGKPWLDALRLYIKRNIEIVTSFISAELPGLSVVPAEATYLMWIDCRAVADDTAELARFIREKTGLYLSSGVSYGNAGKGFLRMNVACPEQRIHDALKRLKTGVSQFQEIYLR